MESIISAVSLASLSDSELLLLSNLLIGILLILILGLAIYGLTRELPVIQSSFDQLYRSTQPNQTHLKEQL